MLMVSDAQLQKVQQHIDQIDEPFKLTEQVITPSGRDYVLDKYLAPYLALSEAEKEPVIDRLFQGWLAWGRKLGFDNREVRAWGRAVIGAEYIICFTGIDEVTDAGQLDLAADVLVRISRWFQTRGPSWVQMRPHAEFLVQKVWGNIEDLRRTSGVCWNATHEGPIRTRTGFTFKM
jgi:hypothetical protein